MHRGLRREFQESIIEDREPLMSGEEGRKDVAVALVQTSPWSEARYCN